MNNDFPIAYRQNIAAYLKNDFQGNWDERPFGAEKSLVQQDIRQQIKQSVKELLTLIGLYDPIKRSVSLLQPNVEQFEWVYQILEDDESRQLLVQVLSFRALGYRHVKLPMNNSHYWESTSN